MKLFQLRNQEH